MNETGISMSAKDQKRFWSKLDKHPGYFHKETECWFWTGPLSWYGYGQLTLKDNSKNRFVRAKAHRLAWVINGKQIKENEVVRHACNNPPCVNPDHLYLSTNYGENGLETIRQNKSRKKREIKKAQKAAKKAPYVPGLPAGLRDDEFVRKVLSNMGSCHVDYREEYFQELAVSLLENPELDDATRDAALKRAMKMASHNSVRFVDNKRYDQYDPDGYTIAEIQNDALD
jgi:hypothetical protein